MSARLRKLQGFNQVVAPFDGVVTRRNIDVGDLVNAGNGGVGQALFAVAQVDPLRLYVFVPQAYAHQVKVGDAVTVSLAERGGEQYAARSRARRGQSIQPPAPCRSKSGCPNPSDALIAGSYVQVTLPIKSDGRALVVPTNVLLFRPDGTRVALVDPGGRVHLALGEIGHGFRHQRRSPARPQRRAIASSLNPADSLADGDVVTLPAENGNTRAR